MVGLGGGWGRGCRPRALTRGVEEKEELDPERVGFRANLGERTVRCPSPHTTRAVGGG